MKNFMSVGNATKAVRLDQPGLTLVLGNNLDLGGEGSRNGTGKTTLFRLIKGQLSPDSGTIEVPSYYRIGGVEQEAPASQTSLLDTVLAADTERSALLAEAETCSDADRIGEIYQRLGDIDAYAAEARASSILAGLGFDQDAQARPCQAFSGGWRMRVALGAVLFSQPDLLLLDEPTNHLDMVSRSIVEEAMASFEGSIVCISHDRHFLNKITNITCEVGNGGVITYQGNYEYYEWKKEQQQNEDAPLVKPVTDKKKDYQLRKQSKNRIAWINKRFKQIEKEIKDKELLLHDVKNKSNASFLNEVMEEISQLENEYFQYIEELDKLNKFKN